VRWSEEEVLWLQQGVIMHGEGNWAKIRECARFHWPFSSRPLSYSPHPPSRAHTFTAADQDKENNGFLQNKQRSQIDLKDKWRNLKKAANK
jgi:hypothetical protein